MATETTGPTLTEIEAARRGLAGVARVTPVYGSETLSRLTGRKVALKAENLQRTGSFKVRGAVTRIAALSESERAAGVVAASAGNHGQAVAWAARKAGIPATIFVPQDAPMAKIEACRNYDAKTELVGLAFEDAVAAAMAYADETGATFVHPYEDETVIAGQGTIGLELSEQVPQAETVLIPVGGGGPAGSVHDRRRNRRQAARGADVRDPRRNARRDGHRFRRGDQRGDRATARAFEARGRGGRRGRGRGASRRACRGSRPCPRRPLGRQHRCDDADLGDAARPHRCRALPRRSYASGRPARRADQAALTDRRGARQPDRGRASPRGNGHPGQRDRGRADAGDPRRGALPPAARGNGRTWLHGRAAQVARLAAASAESDCGAS